MKTYRSKGERINWTNGTGADVASGSLVLVGASLVAVTVTDIASGETGAVEITAEHEVAATTGQSWAQGDVLWLNNTTHKLSNVGGDAVAGKAAKAKASAATTGCVLLGGGVIDAPSDGSVTTAKLANAVQDIIPAVTISAVDGEDGTANVSIQVKDAGGNNLAGNYLLRTWIGGADDFGPDAQTDYSVSTGTAKQEVTADAEYLVITDATGLAVMAVDHGGAGNVYVWVELAGKVYASGAIAITAA